MFRLPSMIKSDGRPCFKSGPFKEFADKYNISHVKRVLTIPLAMARLRGLYRKSKNVRQK